MSEQSLQERYAPQGTCFGCGPRNALGLRIRSYPQGEEVVAEWQPQPHHEAWPGYLSGGIAGTLLDCHSNWAAVYHLMEHGGWDKPPCTVTAEYHVQFRRPMPTSSPVRLRAHVLEAGADQAVVEAELEAGGVVCATCRAKFVAVGEGHPAYHRW